MHPSLVSRGGVLTFIDLIQLFIFSSRRRHTRFDCDWSSDVCSSDLCGWPRRRRSGAASTSSARGCGSYCATTTTSRRSSPHSAAAPGQRARGRARPAAIPDRKSVVEGKRVDLGGRRIIKKKTKQDIE